MENEKPKAIKTIAIAIMALSGMIIFSNGMGGLAWVLLDFEQSGIYIDSPFSFVMSHYVELCLMMVGMGIVYLLGGFFLMKYKMWANRFVTTISVILTLFVWIVMILMHTAFSEAPELEGMITVTIAVAITWTIPFALLIWYLNRKDVAKHFD